jgi:hypothetical protein
VVGKGTAGDPGEEQLSVLLFVSCGAVPHGLLNLTPQLLFLSFPFRDFFCFHSSSYYKARWRFYDLNDSGIQPLDMGFTLGKEVESSGASDVSRGFPK